MKTTILVLFAMFMVAISCPAQIEIDLKGKLKDATNNKANEETDNAIDNGINKVTDGVKGLFGRKKKTEKQNDAEVSENEATEDDAPSMSVNWAKYDFVPGDEVIFTDKPDIMEENGEFPSRWDMVKGQTEIMEVNGENVIGFLAGSPEIIPYLENSSEDYLPEVFTIEFDFYQPAGGNRVFMNLYDRKNQKSAGNSEIEISRNRVSVNGISVGEYPKERDRTKGLWMHISVAYTKGKLKVYLDDTRVINIPRYGKNPTGFSFSATFADNDHLFFMKNVRIAKGGVKYYDRIKSDGKIVCNGIRFEVAKATLLPESMGPINKIYKLMKKDVSINFSVEGHTDADGDDAENLTLSENRAQSVVNKLVSMGIDKQRFTSKGLGETMPVADNSSPEGKANNRRVEFIRTNK